MDKKRLRISLKVLEAVKERFLDTKNFIEDMMEEQCQKEKISVEEVIFCKSKSKKLSCSEYVRDTSLGYNICLRVI